MIRKEKGFCLHSSVSARIIVLVLGLLVMVTAQAMASDEPIGQVVYVEGNPLVVRGGQDLGDTVDFGFSIYNMDQISTDSESMVEVSITNESGLDARIIIEPDSDLYLAADDSQGDFRVNLLQGNSSFEVDHLPRQQSFSVRTAMATMGVRGTKFSVDVAAQGEFLVATESGRVEVANEENDAIMAVPGRAVEMTYEDGFRSFELEIGQERNFRQTWRQRRLDVLRANPDVALQRFATRYRNARDRFEILYQELLEHQDIIDQWIQDDRQNRRPALTLTMRQKAEIARPLMRIAAHLVIFERVYFRVRQLRTLLADASFNNPSVNPREFFREFDRDAAVLRQRMNMIRYVTRLYAQRNNGRLPF